jgi:DNA-binding transcriptional ArsR family regulator
MLIVDNVSAAADRTRIRNLVGVELCLAASAATSPGDEPHADAARRVFGRLPGGARRTLAELDERLPNWPLQVSNTFYRLGCEDIDESLAAFGAQDPHQVAIDMVRASCPVGIDVTDRSLDDVLSQLEKDSPDARRLRRVVGRPQPFLVQIVDVLAAFAESGFKHWWKLQRESADRLAQSLNPRLSTDPARTAAMLSPRVISDSSQDRLIFLSGMALQVVNAERLSSLDLLPSRWIRRRIAIHHTSGRIGIAVSSGPPLRDEVEQLHVPSMLTALADRNRFEIMRLCMLSAYTTTELAPMLGITEGPVSRHLKELEHRGLVSGERVGRYVRYSTSIEAVSLLGQRLQRLPQHLLAEMPAYGGSTAPAA